jgi:hypothetical protein
LAKFFFHSVDCHFTIVAVSFAVQKLNLVQFHFSILFHYAFCFNYLNLSLIFHVFLPTFYIAVLGGLHCVIYKTYYNLSNISYLNSPPPPFSFILLSPHHYLLKLFHLSVLAVVSWAIRVLLRKALPMLMSESVFPILVIFSKF